MIKYLIGALVLGQCCADVKSLQALHKTKAIPAAPVVAEQPEAASSSLKEALHKISLTCNQRQKVILASSAGVVATGLLLYYRKNLLAKSMNGLDWMRRRYHTQMDRDIHLYDNIAKGDLGWAESWLLRGADVNGRKHGETPLHKACEIGNEHLARWLVKHGADINAKDSNGMTPIMRTILHPALGTAEIVYLLMQKGADIDAQDTQVDNVLHKIALRPSVQAEDCMKNLITIRNINAKNSQGETPLMKAVGERGGKDYAVNHFPIDPNVLARITNILLDSGAEIHASDGKDGVLLRAVKGGNQVIVNRLINQYYNDPKYIPEIQNAFHFAVATQDQDLCFLLFTKLIDLLYKGQLGTSKQEREEIEVNYIEQLVKKAFECADKKCAGIMLKSFIGLCKKEYLDDMLDWALWYGVNLQDKQARPDLIEVLMNSGANITKKHTEEADETPLIRATKLAQLDVVNVLLSKIHCVRVTPGSYIELPAISKPLNHSDFRGYTALHYAVESGNTDIVSALLKAGAEWSLAANDGKTPKQLARDNNRQNILKVITDAENNARASSVFSSSVLTRIF